MTAMFFMPFRPAFDSAGVSMPGAKFYFTLTGTNTPAPIYSNVDQTTPLANPVQANATGRIPAIYLVSDVSYRVRVFDRNATVKPNKPIVGTPLEEFDPYIPGTIADAGSLDANVEAAADSAAAAIGAAAEGAAYAAGLAAAASSGMALTAASRSAMALLPTDRSTALTESGREGDFVHHTSSSYSAATGRTLATDVAADTTQAVFVATGTGARVRTEFLQRRILKAKWAGAKLDNSTNDSAAVLAIHALSASLAYPNLYYKAAGIPIEFDGMAYMGTTQLVLPSTCTNRHIGTGAGDIGGGYRSGLRWAAGVDKPMVGTTKFEHEGMFYLGGQGTNTALSGPSFTGMVIGRNSMFAYFDGSGLHLDSNADYSTFYNCSFWRNAKDGFSGGLTSAADVNECVFVSCTFDENGRWGVNDNGFLGNVYYGCRASTNGKKPSTTPSLCCDATATYRYAVIDGQESNTATTAPTGAATSNSVWEYVGLGGVNSSANVAIYNAATTYLAGGSFRITNVNAVSVLDYCYHESGQGLAVTSQSSIIRGGQLCKNVSVASKGAVEKNAAIGGVGYRDLGNVLSSGPIYSKAGIGYVGNVGTGGSVTQATSKTTAVTLNALSGKITMEPTGSIAANSTATFQLVNSQIAAADSIICNITGSAGTLGAYTIQVERVTAGSSRISVYNRTAGALAEALVLQFAIIKGATN